MDKQAKVESTLAFQMAPSNIEKLMDDAIRNILISDIESCIEHNTIIANIWHDSSDLEGLDTIFTNIIFETFYNTCIHTRGVEMTISVLDHFKNRYEIAEDYMYQAQQLEEKTC